MAWTANTIDVLTEAEAKAAVSTLGAARDEVLAVLNTGVTRRLERLVGPIVQRAVANERHDGGAEVIILRRRPAVTASLVVVENRGTSPVALTVEAAATDPAHGLHAAPWDGLDDDGALTAGRLYRVTSGCPTRFWPGSGNIVASYTAGRYENTGVVDPLFKAAARLMLKNLWRGDTPGVGQVGEYDVPAGNWPTYAVPNAVRDLITDELVESPGIA